MEYSGDLHGVDGLVNIFENLSPEVDFEGQLRVLDVKEKGRRIMCNLERAAIDAVLIEKEPPCSATCRCHTATKTFFL
jgi:hypothetical protein